MRLSKPISEHTAREVGKELELDWGNVDLEQFRRGLEVELEHGTERPMTDVTGDDAVLTAKIALAHLNERADYYTGLDAMERGLCNMAEEKWEDLGGIQKRMRLTEKARHLSPNCQSAFVLVRDVISAQDRIRSDTEQLGQMDATRWLSGAIHSSPALSGQAKEFLGKAAEEFKKDRQGTFQSIELQDYRRKEAYFLDLVMEVALDSFLENCACGKE